MEHDISWRYALYYVTVASPPPLSILTERIIRTSKIRFLFQVQFNESIMFLYTPILAALIALKIECLDKKTRVIFMSVETKRVKTNINQHTRSKSKFNLCSQTKMTISKVMTNGALVK
jgi:hypothetical protein